MSCSVWHQQCEVVPFLIGGAHIAVQIGFERVWIQDAFGEHQAIVLVGRTGGQHIPLGIAMNV